MLKKRINLPLALFVKDRTGAIDQDATGLESEPKRPQKPFLLGHELRDVGLAPEPADIGVAANDARRRARRVKQNRIKELGLGEDLLARPLATKRVPRGPHCRVTHPELHPGGAMTGSARRQRFSWKFGIRFGVG